MSEEGIELKADEVPLEGIEGNASELIEMFGGTTRSSGEGAMEFDLPKRRGVPASGAFRCQLTWNAAGFVTLVADRDAMAPKPQRLALLLAGSAGALLWIFWPFFPNLGPAAWIGGAVAFSAYFLTLKRTGAGVAHEFFERLIRIQEEKTTDLPETES